VTLSKKTLEDTLQAFVHGQTQINQSTMQTLQELKTSVERIESRLNVGEKETFPAQPQPNPKCQYEVVDSNSFNPHVEHARSITTHRSAKVNDKAIPKKVEKPEEFEKSKGNDESSDAQPKKEPELGHEVVAPLPQQLL
jgi:hypothetical protein